MEPQRDDLRVRVRVRRFLAHRGVHHDELGGRIDQDDLAADSDQGKPALFAWKQPGLIAIAEIRRGRSRREMGIGRAHRRRIEQPLPRNQLASLPCAVMGKQPAEPRIVAQYGVEAAIGYFLPGAVDRPGCISLGADRLPDPLAKIVRDRLADGGPQHQPRISVSELA